MELHFLKKTTAVTLLITALVCGLTTAAPVGHACNSTVYSYCNEATSSSQVNETLKSLVTEADEILSQIDDVCKEINVCDASGVYPTPKVICTPINRDFLNRRLSVQAVWLKERLQQLNSLCATVDDEDSALFRTCKALQDHVYAFILSLTNYLKMVKCGCPNNVACYYQPDTELSGSIESQGLKEIVTGIFYILQYTERSLIYDYRGPGYYSYTCSLS